MLANFQNSFNVKSSGKFATNSYLNIPHTRLTALFSGNTQVSRYQKGKTNLDFTEARDSEWQWHQLDHMQVCTSLQADNRASTPPLSFLQAGCPSCCPTNSVKALKAINIPPHLKYIATLRCEMSLFKKSQCSRSN